MRREEKRRGEERCVKSSPAQEGPEIHTRKKTRDEKVRKKTNKQTKRGTKKGRTLKHWMSLFNPSLEKEKLAAQWKPKPKLLLLPSRYLVPTYSGGRSLESGIWTGV